MHRSTHEASDAGPPQGPADAWTQVIEGVVRIATATTTYHLGVGDALAPGRRHDLSWRSWA